MSTPAEKPIFILTFGGNAYPPRYTIDVNYPDGNSTVYHAEWHHAFPTPGGWHVTTADGSKYESDDLYDLHDVLLFLGSANRATDVQDLRKQWDALATEDLNLLPKEALIASIKDLARELLERT